jgi:hypothetical protein
MFALLLAAALGAAAPVAAAGRPSPAAPPGPAGRPTAGEVAGGVVRRTSVTLDEAREYTAATVAALRAAGVAVEDPAESLRRLKVLGVDDPTICAGRKVCVLELAKQLEVGAVVALSAAALQQERSVALDAIRVEGATSMARDAAVVKAGEPLPPDALQAIARALAAAFPARPAPVEPPKADAPVADTRTVTPSPAPNDLPAVVADAARPAPEPTSHTATLVTSGFAVAAAVTAAALGAVALSMRSQSTATTTVNGEQVSALPASRAKELAGQANTFGAVAGGAAGLAVALGVVAVVAW